MHLAIALLLGSSIKIVHTWVPVQYMIPLNSY